ncbi:MAG: thr operon leader peptide [Thaumarchaeota archaeon]|nr:thr operon leader peptide [Nitrososphaerota archaeon]
MNKHTVISIVAIIVIIIPFLYSGMNIYAAEQLQYRWGDVERFSFFAMSNSGYVEFCNPTPIWADIKNFQVDLFYDTNNLGTFVVDSVSTNPSSSTLLYGSFRSDVFVESQHVFMTLDFEFDDGDIRLDPTKMYALVTISTPILGIIPYTTSTQYAGFDFDGVMNGDMFDC